MITSTPVLVDGDLDRATYDLLLREASPSGLAFDLETTGLNPITDRIQVITIASPKQAVVVALDHDTCPPQLGALLNVGSYRKIFHNALFDLSFIRHQWMVAVAPVFCTKVAARLAGLSRNPHLQDLVESLVGVRLDKAMQLSDWRERPLSPAQIDYAIRDVVYLHELATALETRLQDPERNRLFQACMDFMTARVELELMDFGDVYAYRLD